ncbi:MAG TPA: ribonucleoside triphosphate reductase, partial [Candidatus Desulfofervidus auxilii]|nr:ribonucleoside triphosphate reductase [Candidatus Desulfofervidus auxilii]
MLKQVIKRDGRTEVFKPEKIVNAILKALKAISKPDYSLAKRLKDQVVTILEKQFNEMHPPTVEDIQDIVEYVLVDNRLYEVAKAYILYRQQHKELRDFKRLLDPTNLIETYIAQTDWLVRENSNMTFSLQGLNSYIIRKIVSEYWLIKIFP